jgi:hypothetical protein
VPYRDVFTDDKSSSRRHLFAFSCTDRFRFSEYRGQVAENGIEHRLLQTRTGMRRGDGQLVEDSAEDHKGYLSMVGRFGARESG